MAQANNMQSFRCKLEATICRASGVNLKLFFCGYSDGKGRRDRYQQNNL